MDKSLQFTLLVQTALLERANGSGWAMHHLAEAMNLIPRIPADVTALQAAEAFMDSLSPDDSRRANPPAWLRSP